jgi:hypothetical protein
MKSILGNSDDVPELRLEAFHFLFPRSIFLLIKQNLTTLYNLKEDTQCLIRGPAYSHVKLYADNT